jgi:hypothetical protein
MTASYRDGLENYYQLPEDIAPAGSELIESELIDFATGAPLIEELSLEPLVGDTEETRVFTSTGNCTPVLIANDEARPASVNITNRDQSEVEVSLLGIPRSETALNLFDTVNIYGVNDKEWSSGGGYTYFQDPSEWTNRPDPNGILYGNYLGHIANESAIRSYSYSPPVSFSFPFDDGTGRFPGGYTNGVMTGNWTSKRAFRYQPGRVTGFTMGVRMSTETDGDGEVIEWGCKNDYGDGYFFRLERGFDLSIVRTSPGLGTLVVPREEWNGDQVRVNAGRTGWGLDLSRVTMFKIEFSWYGAVGAKFMAYVPAGNGEALWVALHYIRAENLFEKPSLRSAYLRMFVSTRSVAGATKPTFIYLYGSSVYIDGGDKGTVTLGTADLEVPKNINATSRSLLGLNIKGTINGVDNQKAVYPVSLAAFASTPARFDIIFRGNSCAGVQYGYGEGTSLSRGLSTTISVTKVGTSQIAIASGAFPDISAELAGPTTYLSGRRVRVTGAGIFNTHITAISSGLTTITTDRPIPDGTTSIRLSRLNAYAIANAAITSGVTSGSLLRRDNSGYWRLGLWPQASGVYNGTQPVVWAASSYSGLAFGINGDVNGELRLPSFFACNESSPFAIAINSGTPSYSLSAGGNSLTVSGTANPWPIAIVAELMDSSNISDVTVFEGTNLTTVGSGLTRAVTSFSVVSGLTETTAAGGADYTAHKFENAISDPLSAVLVDRQGTKAMPTDNRVATFFIGSGETKQFDLSNVFGPDKMFITGPPGSQFNTGALFVMATARAGSGIASAMLNWEEQ